MSNRDGVLVVGSFNVDHVWTLDALPVSGETRSGRYASGAGGKGFNQAIASARSGAATRFVCALGEDAGGQLARALAAASGLDMRDALSSQPTGSAGIFVDGHGRNSIVVAAGANGGLDAAHVAREFSSGDAPVVVLAQLETPAAAAIAAFAAARASGAVSVLNPAPSDASLPRELLELTDILTPNETEFVSVLRMHSRLPIHPDDVAQLPDRDLHELCRSLLPGGTAIVTLGGAGCFVSHAAGALRGDGAACYRIPALQVQPIDTTGAGDAFNGALCASVALAPDAPFDAHVRYAAAFASLSTERAGAAASMPRRADVEARL